MNLFDCMMILFKELTFHHKSRIQKLSYMVILSKLEHKMSKSLLGNVSGARITKLQKAKRATKLFAYQDGQHVPSSAYEYS